MNDKVPVTQYTIKGMHVKEHKSITEAHNNTGISLSGISQACKGERQTSAGGFRWIYSDIGKIKKHLARQRSSPVTQYDKEGNIVRRYSSISEASRAVKLRPIIISRICRGVIRSKRGYYFKFLYSEDKARTCTKMRSVNQLSLQGKIIATFRSSNTAAKILRMSCQSILTACLKLSIINGYKFEFVS
uniref:HNH endonuclease n=1 Tax=Pithovirus LCPAC406 TaxID=2506599 RepID=A0A481ZGA1_9VIRU|nr:MAG: HNH endonuclease [Pithovirus LCPAC406]